MGITVSYAPKGIIYPDSFTATSFTWVLAAALYQKVADADSNRTLLYLTNGSPDKFWVYLSRDLRTGEVSVTTFRTYARFEVQPGDSYMMTKGLQNLWQGQVYVECQNPAGGAGFTGIVMSGS